MCLVNDSMWCILNSGLDLENKEEYVKGVAVQFLVLLETILPDRFFTLVRAQTAATLVKVNLKLWISHGCLISFIDSLISKAKLKE